MRSECGISMLSDCLEWDKFVLRARFYPLQQWFNIILTHNAFLTKPRPGKLTVGLTSNGDESQTC